MTWCKTLLFAKPTPATFTSRHQGHKIILRPRGGFVPTTLCPAQFMSAVCAAATLSNPEYADTQVEIQRFRNLAIFVSKRDSVTQKLTELTSLPIGSTPNQVSSYVASPADFCRIVVHGIEAHATQTKLMANIEAPGSTILSV